MVSTPRISFFVLSASLRGTAYTKLYAKADSSMKISRLELSVILVGQMRDNSSQKVSSAGITSKIASSDFAALDDLELGQEKGLLINLG